jgi:hypothetical protein
VAGSGLCVQHGCGKVSGVRQPLCLGHVCSEVAAGDGRGFCCTTYLAAGEGRGWVFPSPPTPALSLGELKGRTGLQSVSWSRVRNGMRSAMSNRSTMSSSAEGGCCLWVSRSCSDGGGDAELVVCQ